MRKLSLCLSTLTVFAVLATAQTKLTASENLTRDTAGVSVLSEAAGHSGIANKPPNSKLVLQGKFTSWRGTETQSGDAVISVADRDTYSLESSVNGQRTIVSSRGRRMSKVDSAGKPTPISGNALINNDFDFLPSLVELKDSASANTSVQYLGLTDSDAGPVHQVRVTKVMRSQSSEREKILATFMTSELTIDSKTLLVTKRSKRLPRIGNAKESMQTDFHYSDYRPIDGVMVPFKISQFIEGQKVLELTIESAFFKDLSAEVLGGAQ